MRVGQSSSRGGRGPCTQACLHQLYSWVGSPPPAGWAGLSPSAADTACSAEAADAGAGAAVSLMVPPSQDVRAQGPQRAEQGD